MREPAPLLEGQVSPAEAAPQANSTRAAPQPLPGRRPVYCRPEGEGGDDVEAVTLRSRLIICLAWTVFIILLFYTTGLNVMIITVLQQFGVHAPDWLMQTFFPISRSHFVPDAAGNFDMVKQNYLVIAVPWFVVSLSWEALMVQVILPRSCKPLHGYRMNDTISSLSLGILNLLMGQLVFLNWGHALFSYIYDHAKVTAEFADCTNPLGWWLCFFMHDFLYYFYHRWSHVYSWLWTSHVVHHSSEEYNLSTALRQPSNSFFTPEALISTITMAFFFPPELVLLHGQLGLMIQFYIHTQLIPPLPWFELIFNSPALHRIHHARNIRALGKNFGSLFIIWDRLGGTFEDERNDDQEDLHYGVIPPLNSWNPVWANLQHWHHMLFVQPQWHGVLSPFVHWTPPGSKCPKLGARLNPRDKFDVTPTLTSIRGLVLAEFFLLIVGVSYAILAKPSLAFLDWLPTNAAENVWNSSLFCISALWLSSIASLESARSARALRSALAWELARVVALGGMALGFLIQCQVSMIWPFILVGGYTAVHGLVIAFLMMTAPSKLAASAHSDQSKPCCADSARAISPIMG